jgi:hypothetical protein
MPPLSECRNSFIAVRNYSPEIKLNILDNQSKRSIIKLLEFYHSVMLITTFFHDRLGIVMDDYSQEA